MRFSNWVVDPGTDTGMGQFLRWQRVFLQAFEVRSWLGPVVLPRRKAPRSGGVGYRRLNESSGCYINIRGQEPIGMDGRPVFFREASDICDQSV